MKNKFNYSIKSRYTPQSYYVEEIKEELIFIAHKLAKIEDKNPDYLQDNK